MVEARNLLYMFYGFLAAWLIVIAYVITIAMREKHLKQELERVRRMIEEREKP